MTHPAAAPAEHPAAEPAAPMSTRERIIAAASSLLLENGDAKPSVRVIAARAGVGASTLRHHFPSQRALFDAVLTGVYEQALPDARIEDDSIDASIRLTECLQSLLAPVGTGVQAREVWANLMRTFASPDVDEATRLAYPVLVAQARSRVESWLGALVGEGALAPGDNTRRASFLLTVVDGLSIARALPEDPEHPFAKLEQEALADAVDAVLRS